MSRISSMLDIGKRSMMNSQTAMQTTGHNIAGKNVEGFSRQRVEVVTSEPVSSGGMQIGTGARAAKVTRVNNSQLEKQIGEEQSNLGYLKGRTETLARLENVYNEQINKGLSYFLGEFFNAFRELSNNPENLATRNQVKESADQLVKDFKRVRTQVTSIQEDVDIQVKTHTETINNMVKEIATLNEKIRFVEIQGNPANDERDRRDQLLKNLGELVDIQYMESDKGVLTVGAGKSGLILVSGSECAELRTQSTPASGNKREGNLDVIYVGSKHASPLRVTSLITGGVLGGVLEARDQVANDYLRQMDELAATFSTSVNAIHKRGYDRYGQMGQDMFTLRPDANSVVDGMELNVDVKKDVSRIAAALSPNAPGDNRVANMIASLQNERVMGGRQNTMDDFYNSIIGQIGIVTKRANSAYETQEHIVQQLHNIRESVSGVSLDEEATKMIEYQRAFEASARLIRSADEMLETVLNLRRY